MAVLLAARRASREIDLVQFFRRKFDIRCLRALTRDGAANVEPGGDYHLAANRLRGLAQKFFVGKRASTRQGKASALDKVASS